MRAAGGAGHGRPPAIRWVLVLAAACGWILGGCGNSLREEVARQAREAADARATVEATRREVRGLRDELAALREQVEAGLRVSLAARTEEADRARRALEALAARTAAVERRNEELNEALAGLETSVGGLADQVARLETAGGSGGPLRRPGGSRSTAPVSAEELFDRGMASFRAGELGQAVLDFEEFLEKHPGHPLEPSAHFWIGEAYFRTHDFEHAASRYQKTIDLAPTGERTPDALLRLGLALRSLRREDRAREAWSRLVRDFPESEAAQRGRALLREPGRTGRPAPPSELRPPGG